MLLQPRGRGRGLIQAWLPSTRAGGRQQSTPGARGSPRPAAPPGEGFLGRGERGAPAALCQTGSAGQAAAVSLQFAQSQGSTLPRREHSQDLGTNHGSTTAEMPTGPPRLSTRHKELKHCSNCFQLCGKPRPLQEAGCSQLLHFSIPGILLNPHTAHPWWRHVTWSLPTHLAMRSASSLQPWWDERGSRASPWRQQPLYGAAGTGAQPHFWDHPAWHQA